MSVLRSIAVAVVIGALTFVTWEAVALVRGHQKPAQPPSTPTVHVIR